MQFILTFVFYCVSVPVEISDGTPYSVIILCLTKVFGQPKACTSSRECSFLYTLPCLLLLVSSRRKLSYFGYHAIEPILILVL